VEVGVSGVRVALGASVGAEGGATTEAGVLVGGVWALDAQPIKPRHTRAMMDFCKPLIAVGPFRDSTLQRQF